MIFRRLICFFIVQFGLILSALAAVNLDRTRVIFPEQERALSIVIENENKQLPFLAQAWLEDSDEKKSEAYFAIMPPIQRLEAGGKSQVRIRSLPRVSELPQDRESLFFFNLREVPPKSDLEHSLQIAIHNRVKFFYRPQTLKDNSDQLWKEKVAIHKENKSLNFSNDTPFFLTVAYIGADETKAFDSFKVVMIAPYSKHTFSFTHDLSSQLTWGYISDFGALEFVPIRCKESVCTTSNS